MKKSIFTKSKKAILLVYIGFIAVVMFFNACKSDKSNAYQIVKVSGNTFVFNVSKSYSGYITIEDSTMSRALLMEDGDMIEIGEKFFDCYYASRSKEYNIDYNDSLLYINNKLSSINISEEFDVLPILENMKDSDITDLRSLKFGNTIPDKYFPYIDKIASLNKSIGLIFLDKNEQKSGLIKKFDPEWIIISYNSKQDFNVLSELKNTKTLWLNELSEISAPLPKLPQLRQLILTKTDSTINDDFLANNPQIERLFISDKSSIPSTINHLHNLKSLLIYTDSIHMNFDNLNCKQLEVLSLHSEKVGNIESINELPSLKWLTIESNIKQNEFNSILNKHKDLQVLEMVNLKNIKSLEAVTKLSKLYGLVISDSIQDKKTLTTLTKLKYLSVPDYIYNDSSYLGLLHKSIPAAVIVPNQGFCLGSGWLLLLFPLLLLFIFGKKLIKNKI